jgi:hypothetical protein
MTALSSRRLCIGVVVVVLGMLAGGTAQASTTVPSTTVWKLQAAPPGPRPNLFVGLAGPASFPALTRFLGGSWINQPTQLWIFSRVGGTIQEPWYHIGNLASRQCISALPMHGGVTPDPASMEPCSTASYAGYYESFQFRALNGQPGNPGLWQPGSEPRLWRIHQVGTGPPYFKRCVVVPYSQFREGTRLAVQDCTQSPNHHWWLYRSSIP